MKETTLSNGIRVVHEHLPHFRSAALGVWVRAGSVDEDERRSGISHFIEHMEFKGTARRSAQDIAAEMDALGGQLNAFTAKECTCYYAKMMDEHFDKGCDILSDLVLHSAFDEAEMAKEKGVVLEEILMVEDTPDDLVHELLTQEYFGAHPLGSPILGTKETVSAFSREDLTGYMDEHYTADNMLIALAGSYDEAKVLDTLEAQFAHVKRRGDARAESPVREGGKRAIVREKDIEQLNIALLLPGYSMTDDAYYAMIVLNNILGGGMSSRLFQKIREQMGLAYSVYSYTSSHRGGGTLGLYAGTNAAQGEQVLELMLGEMREMRQNGVTRDEFSRSKEQLKGNYVLGSESTSSRMMSLGRSKLLYGRALSEEEVFARIEAVTHEDVQALAGSLFDFGNLCGAFVGRTDKTPEQWKAMW